MAKGALGTLWPTGTLNLREPRLAPSANRDVARIPKPKVKVPKPPKMVGTPQLKAGGFKRLGAL